MMTMSVSVLDALAEYALQFNHIKVVAEGGGVVVSMIVVDDDGNVVRLKSDSSKDSWMVSLFDDIKT